MRTRISPAQRGRGILVPIHIVTMQSMPEFRISSVSLTIRVQRLETNKHHLAKDETRITQNQPSKRRGYFRRPVR